MIRGCGSTDAHGPHGGCPGWADEGVRPTDEQWLGYLRSDLDEAALLDQVRRIRTAVEDGVACFIGNHRHLIERYGTISRQVGDLSNWIDGSYPADLDPEAHARRRVNKVIEEAGETHEALGGMYGENPRKGVTHDLHDVVYELDDTATAALGAVYHLTDGDDVIAGLSRHVSEVWQRAGLGEETPDGGEE